VQSDQKLLEKAEYKVNSNRYMQPDAITRHPFPEVYSLIHAFSTTSVLYLCRGFSSANSFQNHTSR